MEEEKKAADATKNETSKQNPKEKELDELVCGSNFTRTSQSYFSNLFYLLGSLRKINKKKRNWTSL